MKNVIIISESLCYVPNGMGLSDCIILTQATIQIHVSWSISEQQR